MVSIYEGISEMIVAVFRSRFDEQTKEEYQTWAARMSIKAAETTGFVSHKSFVAEDGERVTIVEFESETGLRAWATHPEHLEAKKLGRNVFFTKYRVQICNVIRDSADRRSGREA
jgi:heme-degrading monooxygenase HmoA